MDLKDRSSSRPRVGISACLLGEAVRYDAGHKRSALCVEDLAPWLDFEGLCPEVSIGLGVPRPPIRLVSSATGLRARGVEDPAQDVTEALREYSRAQVARMDEFCGYIFMGASPSCGLHRVKRYDEQGRLRDEAGRGIHAAEITARLPWLPVEEEGRLTEPRLLENFVSRVFALQAWRNFRRAGLSAARLCAFHARFKYSLLASDRAAYHALGHRLADLRDAQLDRVAAGYLPALMAALARPPTRGGHVDALLHLLGYLKRTAPAEERQRLAALIENYRLGELALAAPVDALKDLFARYPHPYVGAQHYLYGYPDGLRLRDRL